MADNDMRDTRPAYETPRLDRLGPVQALTLGAGGSTTDLNNTATLPRVP